MDDLARDVCERQAEAARNEYLVDELEPMQRVAGKQEDAMTIEVRVRWQSVDGREYWSRPHVTTVTFAELRRKPDALWKLLTRCLPFEEWKYVDWSTGDFKERFYLPGHELNADEQNEQEYWWDGFGQNRLYVWDDLEYPERMAVMKERLRDLVLSDEDGPLYFYEHYQPKRELQVGRCWFVLSAIADEYS
jgi:hypothetical protein